MENKRVLVVGSAEQSGGGVASVIKLMKKMPVWEKYHCFWLGTQIQRNYAWKSWYAIRAYMIAIFIIWRYDIVHFHTVPNISMKIQLPIFLLALIGKKKIILHLHVGNQLEKESIRQNKLFHWCLNKSDLIILLAHRFKNVVKEYPFVNNTPITVVYNPCDQVHPLPYDKHEKTILFAGSFTHNKAANLLIEAFSILHLKYPEWKLQLLGSGSEESLYNTIISQKNLEDYVEMPGYVTGEKKSRYFQKAGIYAMCSYLEGFPMVVLESWAYGVPVVSTPVGGLQDVLSDGQNSLVFDFGNVEELVEKLDLLMGNYKLREEMSVFSQKQVEEMFSLESINAQWEELYGKVSK